MMPRVRLRDLLTPTRDSPKVRWYGGYRGVGRADQTIEGLSRYLRQHRLTDTVCGMRVERRPRGEFYFFLTFETDHFGELPPPVSEALEECPLLRSTAGGPYELPDIEKMVSGELKVKALGQCLAYRRMQAEIADDPFQPVEMAPVKADDRPNHLLWYLSALGSGRWATFKAACGALRLAEQGEARQAARALRLLGHVEFSADGDAWSVTPPVRIDAPAPESQTKSFLCGARIPAEGGETTPQPGGPDRLSPAGDELPVALHNPAALLSAHLPDLDAYRESLSVVGSVSDVQHQFARYDGRTFARTTFSGEAGLYEVTSNKGRKMTLHFDGNTWRRGDWYGLRYLTLRDAGRLLPALYNPSTWALALRHDQRPSEIYERTLVLCSGLLPRYEGEWLVYGNVTAEVAERTCHRLELPLERAA